jgi:hypothetical protein
MKAPVKDKMKPRIIQILVAPENSTYQGCVLGLGSDGIVYVCPKGVSEWRVYIKNQFLEENVNVDLS